MEALVITALLLFLVVGPLIVVNRDLLFDRSASRRAPREEPLPFLIIPSSPGAAEIVPGGVAWRRARGEPEVASAAMPVIQPSPAYSPAPAPVITTNAAEAEPEPVRPAAAQRRWARPAPPELEPEPEEPSADATIVFSRPMDEPVQILPGRLQILSGESRGEDLRLFSRLGETPQIVVGRETGPPHRYITLRSPTVSRRHARMDFVDGQWMITNLSVTNPVLVNDRVLKNGGSTRKLSDGDRIELGEVALRFLAS